MREYKLSELKKYHSVVSGDIFFGRTLKWFWAALEGFSSEQFAKLLQFTTGSSQLPPGGFAELSPMFQGRNKNFYQALLFQVISSVTFQIGAKFKDICVADCLQSKSTVCNL